MFPEGLLEHLAIQHAQLFTTLGGESVPLHMVVNIILVSRISIFEILY